MKRLLILLLTTIIVLSAAEKIYVVNALGDQGTISRLENGSISNNIANTGKYPNDIKYNDGKLFVLNSGTNNVKIYNESNLTDAGSCELQAAASNPWKMAISNNKIYITSLYGTGVEVWTTGGTFVKTIVIPDLNPASGTGAIFAYGNRVFVNRNNWDYSPSYLTERMFVLNSETDEIITSFTSGVNVAAMEIDNNNKLHVLCTGNRVDVNGYVKTFNTTTYAKVDSIYLGSQPGAFSKNSNNEFLVAVSGFNADWSGFGGVMKYNANTNQVVNGSTNLLYTNSSSGVMDICLDASGKIYLPLFSENKLVVLNGSTVTNTWTTGDGPQNLYYINTNGIEDEANKSATMITAYPNPFNNSTRINFSLNKSAEITAAVYNQNGQFVQNLVQSNYTIGTHSVDFNANGLNSGVYYVKLTSGSQQIAVQKLLLVK